MRLFLAAFLILGLAACAEREQEPVSQTGEKRYQGKPDTPAWGTGERVAWEKQVKRRQLTQHEDTRIYQ